VKAVLDVGVRLGCLEFENLSSSHHVRTGSLVHGGTAFALLFRFLSVALRTDGRVFWDAGYVYRGRGW